MKNLNKIICAILAIVVCFFFVVSVVDTNETRKQTNFNQDNILTHIEKLSENGPRSIADKEANKKAIEYIASEVSKYGAVEGDTMQSPAYVIQDYVATDTRYQNWYLQNVIVHIPANAEKTTGEAIMFMAHIDSVPMGQGSSDDGVPCSVMLEAIRYYLDKIENGYTLENDLVFCFVNGEEYGLYGSDAFMNEFTCFNNVVERIKFGANLESRGTSGTLIMFETAKNNYNTVKLFSEINKDIFTCSIATMVYDIMPNSTDFTNFKEVYQGINMANIGSGENYHTQNDNPENVGLSYISQQAQIVNLLVEKLANYTLSDLYDAEESAIFFSYLNITTVVYNHTAVIVLAVIGIALFLANIIVSACRKQKNAKKTAKALLALVAGFVLSAAAAYACYYIFQLIAVLFGVIDIHMVGTITYSNTAIVVGIGILTLAVTALTAHFACKLLKIEGRDMTRAFAYIHLVLGVVLSFALPDASYLFIFSGILFTLNELLVTCIKKVDFAKYHGELLVTALYFPVVISVIVLATSALGLTMAYVYGLVFALAIFDLGICLVPVCKYISVKSLIQVSKKKEVTSSPVSGAMHVMALALAIFLVVSVIKPNASVNLQGKQNIAKLPYDDALVYVVDASGETEYRIYDLNAYGALQKYSPDMEYNKDGAYYVGEGKTQNVELSILSGYENNVINVVKNTEASLVYLTFENIDAVSFTVDDGTTSNTFEFGESGTYSIKLHSNCTVTLNGGAAKVEFKELVRDYAPLIPAEYANDTEKLHFNLWLTDIFSLAQ